MIVSKVNNLVPNKRLVFSNTVTTSVAVLRHVWIQVDALMKRVQDGLKKSEVKLHPVESYRDRKSDVGTWIEDKFQLKLGRPGKGNKRPIGWAMLAVSLYPDDSDSKF